MPSRSRSANEAGVGFRCEIDGGFRATRMAARGRQRASERESLGWSQKADSVTLTKM